MPRKSAHQQAIRELEQWIGICIAQGWKADEEAALAGYAAHVDSHPSKPRARIIRDDSFFAHRFANLPDEEFRQQFRITRDGFQAITYSVNLQVVCDVDKRIIAWAVNDLAQQRTPPLQRPKPSRTPPSTAASPNLGFATSTALEFSKDDGHLYS
ncbi:hypothetical protein KVV02_000092 [Mortierella alpina]|uniref:Uncharacterized protein n=1 Tax=Mortierella alpina TaxID=64518 RepID=A0A9P8CYT2_MORAP|nr:hypothetical protein KVV02_000092 [Mortierella alpina]